MEVDRDLLQDKSDDPDMLMVQFIYNMRHLEQDRVTWEQDDSFDRNAIIFPF